MEDKNVSRKCNDLLLTPSDKLITASPMATVREVLELIFASLLLIKLNHTMCMDW
jgi:hypothetical protein